LINFGLVLIFK